MKFLHLVWSNLKRKKLRTILTVLSIVVAFLLFSFLSAIKQALVGGVRVANANRLVVRHKVSIIQLLPVSYENRIGQIAGVDLVTHETWFGGIYQDPKNFFATMPVEPEKFLEMFPEIVLPEAQKQTWLKTRTGAIVGRTTAERFHWKIGDRIPIQSPIWPRENRDEAWEFDLVGIYDGANKATDTSQFFFRYDYFDEARAWGKGQVGWYLVRVKDPTRAAQVATAIDKDFANSPFETKAEPEGAFAKAFAQQVGDIGAIMTAILSAVFFHHPARGGQYDGASGARTNGGTRRPESHGVQRPARPRPGPGRIMSDRGGGRIIGTGTGVAHHVGRQPRSLDLSGVLHADPGSVDRRGAGLWAGFRGGSSPRRASGTASYRRSVEENGLIRSRMPEAISTTANISIYGWHHELALPNRLCHGL